MAMLRVHRLAALLASAALFCPAMSGAAPQADPAGQLAAPSFQVVISGRYRGPRLWRVSRDGHVLWVLGTVSPLPKKKARR